MKTFSSWAAKLWKMKEIKVIQPEEISVSFDSIIGLKNAKNILKDTIDYIKEPQKFECFGVRPHMHYLLQGEDGVGKSSLAYATAKEANIPIVVIDCKEFVTSQRKTFRLLSSLFNSASPYDNAVILMKGFDNLFKVNDAYMIPFLCELVQYMENYPNIVVITTLSHSIYITEGNFILDENAFSKAIVLNTPDLDERQEMYKLFCEPLPIDDDVSFYRLALDSYDMTAKDILKVVKNAALLALHEKSATIKYKHFDEFISNENLGQKQKRMTDKERIATAYHEAGHVVAAYYSDPDFAISKVEVSHRSQSLGVTISDVNEDKVAYFKSDYEHFIIRAYGGLVAERIIYGENSSGVTDDLVKATSFATLMVSCFGMGDDNAYISVPGLSCPASLEDGDDPYFLHSDNFIDDIDVKVERILSKLYNATYDIVSSHRNELDALAKALSEKEVIYGNEIKEIFESIKEQPNE